MISRRPVLSLICELLWYNDADPLGSFWSSWDDGQMQAHAGSGGHLSRQLVRTDFTDGEEIYMPGHPAVKWSEMELKWVCKPVVK